MIESISSQYGKDVLPVSFRGSLAQKLYDLRIVGASEHEFIWSVLNKISNPDIVAFFDNEKLVVGLAKDKGKYYPDW